MMGLAQMDKLRVIDIGHGDFYKSLQEEICKAAEEVIKTHKSIQVKAMVKLIPDADDDAAVKLIYSAQAVIPARAGLDTAIIVDDTINSQNPVSEEEQGIILNFTGEDQDSEEETPRMKLAN